MISLNQGQARNSFSTDLALDAKRNLLFVVDRANSRLAIVDSKSGHLLSSLDTGKEPGALAIAPDQPIAYVTDPGGVTVADVANPKAPRILRRLSVSRPGGVLAAAGRVFVSNSLDDSIAVFSAVDGAPMGEIPLRISALETLRGVSPGGMAFDPVSKWLLVAETGINAVGVVDTAAGQLIGHIPAGWMPARVALSGDRAFVTNIRGNGTGPRLRQPLTELGETPALYRGTVRSFVIPSASELPKLTMAVYAANGMNPVPPAPHTLPDTIRQVVFILSDGRSFDEVLGDIAETRTASNGNPRVQAFPKFAIYGLRGIAEGGRGRFSLQDAAMTPNQHAIARRNAFGDNFYSDGDVTEDALRWLGGDPPGLFDEAALLARYTGQRNFLPDADPMDALRRHLEQHGVRLVETDSNNALPAVSEDLSRPRLTLIHLRDTAGTAHPYLASSVADHDLAVGRILESLSHSPAWRETVAFVTSIHSEGLDHIDSHRVPLLAAGPWVRRGYVTHTNSSFPGLLRTAFELLRVPPMNLHDATAASLRDLFTAEPDFSPFEARVPDKRVYDPE